MATIVDALVVTLGIDPRGLIKGKQDASKATKKLSDDEKQAAKETEDRNKRAADSFKKIRNEVLALVAVFTAGVGIKNFAENTINSAAGLGIMSKNLRMTTRDLSAWQRANERAGGTADGITNTLLDSQNEIAKFNMGQLSDGVSWFLRMGGNVKDLKDGNTYLLARSRIIANLFKVDPGRARYVANAMGIGDDSFNLLKQGQAGVLALVAAQKQRSVITDKEADQALELRNRFLDLRDTFTSVGTKIVLSLMPAFERLIGYLQQLGDWVAAHRDEIAKKVGDLVDGFIAFAKATNDAVDALGGWKNVLLFLAGLKLVSMTSGLLGLAGSISAVGTALGALGGTAAVGGLALLAGAAGISINALKNSTEPGHFVGRQASSPLPKPYRYEDTNAGVWDRIKSGVRSFFSTEGGHFASRQNGAEQQRARVAMDYFMSQGWSREQAAGMVGSLIQEGGLDPSIRNKTSGAYGIGQWLGARVGDFKAWSGHDLEGSSLQEQLAFMQYELTQGKEQAAGRALRATTTAAQAAAVHATAYERPGAAEANIGQRQAYAAALLASSGQSNAAQLAAQSGAAASQRGPYAGSALTSSSVDTTINGGIHIHTQSTDPKGIADEFGKRMSQGNLLAPQANTGLS
ncbi:Phage tail lysozyme domain-containing protein [Pararobbsia alpina]|uniref:phage tail tip lysozyme n=1 Tax=Pararobbsia alpina TaxID=621374 RepID=UPI0039A42F19